MWGGVLITIMSCRGTSKNILLLEMSCAWVLEISLPRTIWWEEWKRVCHCKRDQHVIYQVPGSITVGRVCRMGRTVALRVVFDMYNSWQDGPLSIPHIRFISLFSFFGSRYLAVLYQIAYCLTIKNIEF